MKKGWRYFEDRFSLWRANTKRTQYWYNNEWTDCCGYCTSKHMEKIYVEISFEEAKRKHLIE